MRRQLVLWGVLAGLLLGCEHWLTACVGAAPCLAGAGVGSWLTMGLDASGVLLAGAGAALGLRATWLLLACSCDARRLALADCPPAVAAAARELGAGRLRVLAVDRPMAFCAGALRPVVYLSLGLCVRLEPEQLQAVLLHELDHAGRREPLRRALMQAAREVGFFLPVLGWTQARRLERSELRADQRAIERLGPRAVALALWAIDSRPGPAGLPAFAGAARLRVAQLLGDPIPRSRPPVSLCAASLMGTLFAVAIVGCAAEIAAVSLR